MNVKDNIDNLKTYIELIENGFNEDIEEFNNLFKKTIKDMDSLETLVYLNEEFDTNNVIFEIHAGAGGTEAAIGQICYLECIQNIFIKRDIRMKY